MGTFNCRSNKYWEYIKNEFSGTAADCRGAEHGRLCGLDLQGSQYQEAGREARRAGRPLLWRQTPLQKRCQRRVIKPLTPKCNTRQAWSTSSLPPCVWFCDWLPRKWRVALLGLVVLLSRMLQMVQSQIQAKLPAGKSPYINYVITFMLFWSASSSIIKEVIRRIIWQI